jgi:hypothetical protein
MAAIPHAMAIPGGQAIDGSDGGTEASSDRVPQSISSTRWLPA